jgi:hypothetical protein
VVEVEGQEKEKEGGTSVAQHQTISFGRKLPEGAFWMECGIVIASRDYLGIGIKRRIEV